MLLSLRPVLCITSTGSRRIVHNFAIDPSRIRNIALVAHIDSGKTTLTESILLSSNFISTAGSVDTGSTTTDFLPAERERGITIQSASIPVTWKNWTFNLIDTPGHADFGMEVESASRVVDGAVVLIDSVEGVEAQTKGVWKQLDRYNVPTRLIFLNKLDRPGASFRASFLSLMDHRLHPTPMVLTIPIASFNPQHYNNEEPGIEGLVDLVKWEVWKWNEHGGPTHHPLPRTEVELKNTDIFPNSHPIVPHLIPARMSLLENLSMFSDNLMDRLIVESEESYLKIEASAIIPDLRNATIMNQILPVFCGSAMKNVGTELVMNYIGELLASPLDVDTGLAAAGQPLVMLAWKVGWDKRKGWMTFVRIYAGSLNNHSVVLNKTRNVRERVSKLFHLYASHEEEVKTLSFGDVGVIIGLRHTRTGDTLVSGNTTAKTSSPLRDIVLPPAVMSASIIPQSHSDLETVQEALNSLARTDPSVRIEVQEGQTLVHGLGALHLEIVEGRLREEFNARFEFGKRRVNYREGFGPNRTEAIDIWTTEIKGQKVDVEVNLTVMPLPDGDQGDPAWDGNVVIDKSGTRLGTPESFENNQDPLAQITRGLTNALSSSPHTGLSHTGVHVQVHRVACDKDIPSSVFASAVAVIMRKIVRAAGIGPVFEPYTRFKISVDETALGKVVKDLTENGGEVLDMESNSDAANGDSDESIPYPKDAVYVPPEWISPSSRPGNSFGNQSFKRFIHAIAPLSKMLDYSKRLRVLSGGNATFEMTSDGFRQVTETRKLEILKELGRF